MIGQMLEDGPITLWERLDIDFHLAKQIVFDHRGKMDISRDQSCRYSCHISRLLLLEHSATESWRVIGDGRSRTGRI